MACELPGVRSSDPEAGVNRAMDAAYHAFRVKSEGGTITGGDE